MKVHPAIWIVGGLVAAGGAGLVAAVMRGKGLNRVAPLPTVLVGDSMGVGLTSPLRMAGMPIHSIALQGTTVEYWTKQGAAALQAALATKPGAVLVALGTNDAFNGDSYAPRASAAVDKLIVAIRATGAEIYWISPPKLPASYGGKAPSQAVLDAIREAVQKAPDVFWIESSDLTIPRSADGLHPTGAGYSYWSDIIVDRLGLSFVSPSSTTDTVQGDTFGADIPPPPSPIVIPDGWKQFPKGAIVTPALRSFAVSVLVQRRPIGDLQVSMIEGKSIGALTTWHYDDHVGHVLKWHRGISLLQPEATS